VKQRDGIHSVRFQGSSLSERLSEGINLGKADYVARMLPYLRPETIPKD